MTRISLLCGLLLAAALLAGCGPQPDGNNGGPVPDATGTPALDGARLPEGELVYQWASSAEASSSFADPEWSAGQAVGPPDSPGCGDYQSAWASAASDSVETLVLEYPRPVYPLEIVIYQSFNPDQVVKAEVLEPDQGIFSTVLQKNPQQVDRPCPYELIGIVNEIEFQTDTVRITIDQSQLGLGWNEIDAVGLMDVNGNIHWAIFAEASSTYAEKTPRTGTPVMIGDTSANVDKESIPPNTIKITYVDDTMEGKRSIGASGHGVLFERPEKNPFIEAVQIYVSRYGSPEPPEEDFHHRLRYGGTR